VTALWAVLLAAPLSFGDVIESLDRHPELAAADAKIDAARAKQRKADGAFDTYASADAKVYPTGKNQREMVGVFVEQPTPLWGAQLSAGWRRGVGEVPPYEGERATVDEGELALGLRLPLLRGRGTDPARTEIRRARLDVQVNQAVRDEKRRALTVKAAKAYWKWVASGHVERVYARLLDAARQRDEGMRTRVKEGDAPEVSLLETRRALLKREAQLIKARRSVEKAAIKLGLYYRIDGRPAAPSLDALPGLPAPSPLAGPATYRPAIEALRSQARRARIASELGENDQLPQLDLEAMAVQPLGDEKSELAAGLKFSLPLQRRKAQGEAARAQAEARQVEANARWLNDQIDARIRDARSAAQAAQAQVAAAKAAAEAADAVVTAQRDRLEYGDAEILTLNLREQAAAEARVAWLKAKADWQIAAARLAFATGVPTN
jgi:outer membrane protein TolC